MDRSINEFIIRERIAGEEVTELDVVFLRKNFLEEAIADRKKDTAYLRRLKTINQRMIDLLLKLPPRPARQEGLEP